MNPPSFKLDITSFAVPIKLLVGEEVRLKGSYRNSFDGSVIDAASTTWPEGAPGGEGVDAAGLIDFTAGGLKIVKRDPKTHEIIAVSTGKDAPACAAAGVAAPCLALRTAFFSQRQLVTREEFKQSLDGEILVENLGAPPPPRPEFTDAPATSFSPSPLAYGLMGVAGVAAVAGAAWMIRRRQKLSPQGQLKDLVARVSRKLKRADTTLSAALEPVVRKTLTALNDRKVDARSKEGQRVAALLLRVESRLDETVERERAAKEQAAADELVLEVESALEAAQEAARL